MGQRYKWEHASVISLTIFWDLKGVYGSPGSCDVLTLSGAFMEMTHVRGGHANQEKGVIYSKDYFWIEDIPDPPAGGTNTVFSPQLG